MCAIALAGSAIAATALNRSAMPNPSTNDLLVVRCSARAPIRFPPIIGSPPDWRQDGKYTGLGSIR